MKTAAVPEASSQLPCIGDELVSKAGAKQLCVCRHQCSQKKHVHATQQHHVPEMHLTVN